jgi:hypothetical protein
VPPSVAKTGSPSVGASAAKQKKKSKTKAFANVLIDPTTNKTPKDRPKKPKTKVPKEPSAKRSVEFIKELSHQRHIRIAQKKVCDLYDCFCKTQEGN